LFSDCLVLILGAGDLASGVAYRLVKAGFPVVMTELAQPTMVRTTVSYGVAVLHDAAIIEGIQSRRATLEQVHETVAQGAIPVVVDPEGHSLAVLQPTILIDARLAKRNLGITAAQAPLVVALGPGFTVGEDCHAIVETNRGHRLGRVYWSGAAEPDTGIPGMVNGKGADRVLRAPADGIVSQRKVIGQNVVAGELLAMVGDVPLYAPFDGALRGLIDDDIHVVKGMKIGDLDPRLQREHCYTLSDKSLAIGGGVVEACLSASQIRERLYTRDPRTI
jgi:xanthine dehydrogenase accessory factor